MPEPAFDDPRIALNRIYTRRGDEGETSLAGGRRVAKDSPRIEAYGTVDELNTFVGAALETVEALAAAHPPLARLASILRRVQHELFNLGSILATPPEEAHLRQPRVTEAETRQLEAEIDEMNRDLGRLRSFVLPGGHRLNADLHICRTVCRRAERRCVTLSHAEQVSPEALRYLNRLSDALFVWSRWASRAVGAPENLWDPNQAASGRQTGEPAT